MMSYWVLFIGIAVASWLVQMNLQNKFKKYSKIPTGNGMTGRDVALKMLHDNGIYDVQVTHTPGQLTDHYNPANKTVNLSPDVYNGRSAAAAAVAAHECGHAVQHAKAYRWLEFRSAMVPIQNVSARVINFIFIAMFIGAFGLQMFNPQFAILIIIGCYSVFTLFAFVTLPVEYDASNRALAWIKDRNIVDEREHAMAKDALNAAASTYLVAALGALATLLYYVMIFLGSRD